jgi:hypothetical protein
VALISIYLQVLKRRNFDSMLGLTVVFGSSFPEHRLYFHRSDGICLLRLGVKISVRRNMFMYVCVFFVLMFLCVCVCVFVCVYAGSLYTDSSFNTLGSLLSFFSRCFDFEDLKRTFRSFYSCTVSAIHYFLLWYTSLWNLCWYIIVPLSTVIRS